MDRQARQARLALAPARLALAPEAVAGDRRLEAIPAAPATVVPPDRQRRRARRRVGRAVRPRRLQQAHHRQIHPVDPVSPAVRTSRTLVRRPIRKRPCRLTHRRAPG